jgi:hypothetical protein
MIKLLLILLMVSAVCTFLLFVIFWTTRKVKEKAYEEDYIFVVGAVRHWSPSPQTYEKIIGMLTKLALHNIDDPVRTKQLWAEFNEKFSEYTIK